MKKLVPNAQLGLFANISKRKGKCLKEIMRAQCIGLASAEFLWLIFMANLTQ